VNLKNWLGVFALLSVTVLLTLWYLQQSPQFIYSLGIVLSVATILGIFLALRPKCRRGLIKRLSEFQRDRRDIVFATIALTLIFVYLLQPYPSPLLVVGLIIGLLTLALTMIIRFLRRAGMEGLLLLLILAIIIVIIKVLAAVKL